MVLLGVIRNSVGHVGMVQIGVIRNSVGNVGMGLIGVIRNRIIISYHIIHIQLL
jgi:hypothetical protein